ncbi:MAG TPA: peroxiredoxin [Gammaproteobacteria bacterium]|nr:peroxiredoxin [Gammaproteobacteria bacterium]
MLETGARAPDFTLPDQNGDAVHLAAVLASGPVLLYFYPADFTPGCTREACAFRDLYPTLAAAKLTVLGVSPQDSASHRRFREKYHLPFSLLADPERTVIRAYQCEGPLGLLRRTSYRIGPDGTIRRALRADLRIGRHRAFAAEIAEP